MNPTGGSLGVDSDQGDSVTEKWELPTDEQVRKDIRYCVDPRNSLNAAVRQVIKDQTEILWLVVLGFVGAGGPGR